MTDDEVREMQRQLLGRAISYLRQTSDALSDAAASLEPESEAWVAVLHARSHIGQAQLILHPDQP